jgi:membrane fusion protein, copper/silver efflux system
MKMLHWIGPAVLLALLALAGCEEGVPGLPASPRPAAEKSEKETSLAQLSPEDRRLAERQRVCPVTGEALGEMGEPVKVTVKGETVFLCCDGCKKKALDNPDKTQAAVNKAKSSPSGQ